MSRQTVDIAMFGGIYGEYYCEFPNSLEHTASVLKRCADVGVSKYIPSYQIGVIPTHPWVIFHRSAATGKTEPRGNFWLNTPSEPDLLASVAEIAHQAGVEIHPYVHVGASGVWLPKFRSPVGERLPLGYGDGFASEHPEWWTRDRDGRTWLDFDPLEPQANYGYMSVIYPEVRQYLISLFSRLVTSSAADGISLEFVTTFRDATGSWLYGYDAPALEAFREQFGRDPLAGEGADADWEKLRANYMTEVLRELRAEIGQTNKTVDISVATEGVWHDPASAHRVMVDWPTWLDEGLVDTLYPRFWLYAPADLGKSAMSNIDEIRSGVETVRQTANGRSRVYGGLICASFQGEVGRAEMAELLLNGARAVMEAGADGVGIHRIDTIVALDLWDVVEQIAEGRF